MSSRVILADGMPGQTRCLSLSPDAEQDEVRWLLASGPGAEGRDAADVLGELAPFAQDALVHVDTIPEPRWDLDALELRFALAESPEPIQHRLPVATVGPELTPGLGVEGEVLQARRVAIRLANLLGSPRELH